MKVGGFYNQTLNAQRIEVSENFLHQFFFQLTKEFEATAFISTF